MAEDGAADKFVTLEAVHHGDVGGEVTAPAHAHGGEDRDVVRKDEALGEEAVDQTDCGACGTECGHRNGDGFTRGEAEEGLEDEVALVGEPGEEADAFVGGAGVVAVCARTIGEHHHEGTDNQHARNDGRAHLDAALTTI